MYYDPIVYDLQCRCCQTKRVTGMTLLKSENGVENNTRENLIAEMNNFEDIQCERCGVIGKWLVLKIKLDTNEEIVDSPITKPTIEWSFIPGGTFIMGSPLDEKGRRVNEAQKNITLSSFIMSKYQVTFEQYDKFCEATNRIKPNDNEWGRDRRPVINVTPRDAQAFAEWMGCRLPTEEEWEYGCRAGTTTSFNTGSNLTTFQANFNGVDSSEINYVIMTIKRKTLPVGSFLPNAWDLYDMHGNVNEWCIDSSIIAQNSESNKTSLFQSYIIRGGSWFDDKLTCRSAFRCAFNSDMSNKFIGFRVVSDLNSDEIKKNQDSIH